MDIDNLTHGSDHASDDLDAVAAALRATLDRLLRATHDVAGQPINNIASPQDVAWLQNHATPGAEARPLDQVVDEAFSIFDHRLRVNHPRFMGLIPSPTHPVAWLGDAVASAFNALGASKLQASGPVAVEKTLIDWLGERVGLPAASRGGVFVSGGSMANLMAVAMARDRHLAPEEYHGRAVAYVTGETHFSVVKALRVLGFGPGCVRRVAVTEEFGMDVGALEAAIQADREEGRAPFVVVATCGTTNTGAVDPMRAISEVCRREGVWMHVDGAYGASVALSAGNRHLVEDLKYADSISWDAHKWLFQTYSCGILLVRSKPHLLTTFANSGDYLRDGAAHEDSDIPNYWDHSLELTRPAHRAMKLWFTLRVLGTEHVAQMIDHGFALARAAEETLRALPGWTITSSSQSSLAILTFRFAPEGQSEGELDALNAAISAELVASNTAGILTTKVQGKVVLRICALSPQLRAEEMRGIVAEADGVARRLVSENARRAS